jgi:hypothetical protein
MYCAVGILHKDKNTWVIFFYYKQHVNVLRARSTQKTQICEHEAYLEYKNSSNLPNIILGFVLGRVRDKTS